jgi:DNA helicase-2/ATP-dependent DNA helicase PcrA
MDILAELNPAQREAVEAINGPVLILAGPGSGKTRVITHRIAYLIKVCGVSPRRIMAVTFTNKAAREMENRLFGKSEEDPATPLLGWSYRGQVTIGTFHAICARILRRDGQAIGISTGFVIYDDDDQISLLKRSLQELNLDPKQYAPRAIQSAITAAKSRLLTPEDYLQQGRSYFEEIVQRVYERYEKLLTASGALDFDDLLLKTVHLFQKDPEVLARYQSRYLHIQVDEFQDTNLVQYELMKLLAAKYRNICVVGDPDQSIYSWRAADLRNILNFEKDYPEARVVLLEQNYRSTKIILETASHVISANQQRKEKKLWTENEAGTPAAVIETYNEEEEEAQFVVSEIDRLVSQEGMNLGDCAVMYRTNAQSRALEEAFIRYGTPYKLVAGTRFYERREVKDVIAYLRLIQNPSDSVSLLRIINVPQRGIGQRSLDELSRWARAQGLPEYQALQLLAGSGEVETGTIVSPRTVKALAGFAAMMEGLIARSRELNLVELFDLAVESTRYKPYVSGLVDGEERWENVMELRTVAQEYRDLKPEEGLPAFLEGVALVSDVDGLDSGTNAVTLITLHQAKGLEFPVVFIVGMEEGLLPHFRSIDDPGQLEEERRLCYVGITRAQKRVYLVHAFRRSLMGSSAPRQPSRFLKDIPSHLVAGGPRQAGAVESQAEPEAVPTPEETPQPRYHIPTRYTPPEPRYDLPEFKAGDHVRHVQFGEGIVVSCHMMKNDAEVVVVFDGAGVKRLLLSFARMEKV